MDLEQNASPVGAADTGAPPAGPERQEQPTSHPIFSNVEAAVAALDKADQDQSAAPPRAPVASEPPPAEPETPIEVRQNSDEEPTVPQPEAPDAEEIETPAYKAESEDDDAVPEGKIHGNTRVRLRDNSTVQVKELIQAREQLQEYQRTIPSIQQAAQQLAQEKAQLAQHAQSLQQLLPLAMQKAQADIPPPPTAKLWDEDPIEAGRQDFLHRQKVAEYRQLQAAHHQQQQEQQRQQTEAERQRQEQAAQETSARIAEERQKLLKAMPHLNTPEKCQAYAEKFTSVGKRLGFNEDEINNVHDARLIMGIMHLAEKADKWDALQAQKPKAEQKAQGAAPVQAPGPRVSNAEQVAKRREEGLARLSKTGSIDDAVALLNTLG